MLEVERIVAVFVVSGCDYAALVGSRVHDITFGGDERFHDLVFINSSLRYPTMSLNFSINSYIFMCGCMSSSVHITQNQLKLRVIRPLSITSIIAPLMNIFWKSS